MSILNWIKTNKTTIIGSITVIYGAVMSFLLAKNYIDVTTSVMITTVLTGLGLIASKDGNKHSTVEEVEKATIDKIVEEDKEVTE